MCHRRCVPVRRDLFDWFTDVSMYRIMCDIDTAMLSSMFEHSSFAVCESIPRFVCKANI